MRALTILILFLAACTNSIADDRTKINVEKDNPTLTASQYLNYTETTHRQEIRNLTGVDPVRTEWCAAFVNAVLEESNIKSNNSHKYPLTARAFLDWGLDVEDPVPGDIIVFPRGNSSWQGHVGFYISTQKVNDREYYLILGGNQNNKVSIVPYPASSALGIRRWIE